MKLLLFVLLSASIALGQLNQIGLSYYVKTDSENYTDTDTIRWLGVMKNDTTDTIQVAILNGTIGEWFMVDTSGNIYDGWVFIPIFIIDTVNIAPSDSTFDEWFSYSHYSPLPTGDFYGIIRPWSDDYVFPYDTVSFQIIEKLNIDNEVNLDINGFKLHQAYPNPFNAITTIRYKLSTSSKVKLSTYDIFGREIAVLTDTEQNPGLKQIQWNASTVPSGIYFIQMQAGDFRQVRKVMLLK